MADLALLAEGRLTSGEFLTAHLLEQDKIQLKTHTNSIVLQVQAQHIALQHQTDVSILSVHCGGWQAQFELTPESASEFNGLLVLT
ncbi:hypothetical protein K6Y31_17310 [Motilimonas cestriensis]|uniref:Uncharacterized protein n=1 Tax=Motilimonas cestriensis TaxID=2742685 RepID=A0ABS8WFP4_9GAMM|nr:hypothetical protein [Motilimonas cestriensis]MCE2596556.1 hypothetical protein [Motilimonas cestriensis]